LRILDKRILDTPVPVYFPGLDRVEIAHDLLRFQEKVHVGVPELGNFKDRWLYRAGFIRAAGLQDGLIAVPSPRAGESSVRFPRDGIVELRALPVAASTGRDLAPLDGGRAGPRQPCDLMESGAGHFISAGGLRDYGFWSQFEFEPARFAVESHAGVPARLHHGHVRLVHQINASQPFDVVDPLPARNYQAQGETLFWTHRLAVLPVSHERVVQGLPQWNAFGVFGLIGAFRDDPCRALLHAGLFEKRGQQDSRPLAATSKSVCFLGSRIFRNPGISAGTSRGAVAVALYEMKPGYEGQAL